MAKKRGRKQARNRQHTAPVVAVAAAPRPSADDRARAMGRALAGTVARRDGGRVTMDRPEMAFAGSLSLLPPTEGDIDWRLEGLDGPAFSRRTPAQILDLLCDLSPDVSRALWDFLRFANPGWEISATLPGSKDIDKRAQANLDAFMETLKSLYGTVDVVLNRLFFGAFLRGAFFAELVLDKSGMPADIATPDPKIVKFQSQEDEVRGHIWQPYQYQGAQRIPLDIPTIRYVPVDPAPGNPYGRPLATPAVFATVFLIGLMHDLRRVVAQQGYPRLDIEIDLEAIKKAMPMAMQGDLAELQKAVDGITQQVAAHYRTLQPDDAYVHSSATKINRPVGTVDSSSLGAIDGLLAHLKEDLRTALKSSALMMGTSAGLSESSANRLSEIFASGIRAMQHACESLLEYLLELALQSMGTPASVSFKLAELRKSEELRDEQTFSLKLHNAALAYALGYVSQDGAAKIAVGVDVADQQEPRIPGAGIQAASAGANDPNAVVAEPGQARMLPDFGRALVNGNGHAKEVAA